MRAANAGDRAAYHCLLSEITPYIRGLARRRLWTDAGTGDVEDVVQEILLAIHLKRQTWDEDRPIGPWIATIARNKVVDALRRRSRQLDEPIEDFENLLPVEAEEAPAEDVDVEGMLQQLQERPRTIVRLVSIEGLAARDVANQLDMSEGAVRVALHRALKSLAALYRNK
ncbi:RNA polymerase sigma factor SigM [Hartmannibacter diazotrophicus]|uniref:RNA polymerase sigma factor SigM n=2 Tax=Hartmannibacter diazotrophicus TaxID=1482074 RepID=A0A2C9D9A8_9HYPH|nr:RNA polymerase sigma factor SigM [Hartmannibacter diazotrophicus]